MEEVGSMEEGMLPPSSMEEISGDLRLSAS